MLIDSAEDGILDAVDGVASTVIGFIIVRYVLDQACSAAVDLVQTFIDKGSENGFRRARSACDSEHEALVRIATRQVG